MWKRTSGSGFEGSTFRPEDQIPPSSCRLQTKFAFLYSRNFRPAPFADSVDSRPERMADWKVAKSRSA